MIGSEKKDRDLGHRIRIKDHAVSLFQLNRHLRVNSAKTNDDRLEQSCAYTNSRTLIV